MGRRAKAIPILGKLILRRGFATRADLERALEKRLYQPELSLRQVLSELPGVGDVTLDGLVEDFLKAERQFLELLTQSELITDQQRLHAMQVQGQRSRRGVLLRASTILEREGATLRLGPYDLVECLGRGAMGAVFQARHAETRQPVALKVMRPELARDGDAVARFLREARILTAIRHPNVVRHLETGRAGSQVYLATELVRGQDLRGLLNQQTKLPVTAAVPLALKIFEGLAAVHEKGIVHRDLKPDNILLTLDGVPKISDFGLARREGGEESLAVTMPGTLLGTPHYMSPEQCRGEEVSTHADLYAMGALFYHLVVGRPPFVDRNLTSLIEKQLSAPPPNPADEGVPAGVSAIILQLLSKDEGSRGGTALAVIEQLRGLATGTDEDLEQVAETICLPPESVPIPDDEAEDPDEDGEDEPLDAGPVSIEAHSPPEVKSPTRPLEVLASASTEPRGGRRWPWKSTILAVMALTISGIATSLRPTFRPLLEPDAKAREALLAAERKALNEAFREKDRDQILEQLRLIEQLMSDKELAPEVVATVFHGADKALERHRKEASVDFEDTDDRLVKTRLPELEAALQGPFRRAAELELQRTDLKFGLLIGVRERVQALRAAATGIASLQSEAAGGLQVFRDRYKGAMEAGDPAEAARLAWQTYCRYGDAHGEVVEVLLGFAEARQAAGKGRWDFRVPAPEEPPVLADELRHAVEARVGRLQEPRAMAAATLGLVGLLFGAFALLYGGVTFALWFVAFARYGGWIRLYTSTGRLDKAIAVAQRAGLLEEAAELALEADNPNKAGDLFLEAGRLQRAAGCFERGRSYDAATQCYEEMGDLQRAAEMALKAERFDAAANLFTRAGALARAAEACVKGGQVDRAAELYVEEGRVAAAARLLAEDYQAQNRKRAPGLRRDKPERAAHIARLYLDAGQPAEAAPFFDLAGDVHAAAAAYRDAGMRREAVEAFVKSGQREQAIELLDALGDVRAASLQRAELALSRNEFEVAGEAYERAGDMAAASRAWEQQGDFARAARCAHRAQDASRAADMLAAAGEHAKAALAYERLEQPLEALHCYEQAGDFLSVGRIRQQLNEPVAAARAFFRAGHPDEALSELDAVQAEDADFYDAVTLKGEVLAATAGWRAALDALRAGLKGDPVDRYNASAWRLLVDAHEHLGEVEHARGALRLIIDAGQGSEGDQSRMRRYEAAGRGRRPSQRIRRATTTVTPPRQGAFPPPRAPVSPAQGAPRPPGPRLPGPRDSARKSGARRPTAAQPVPSTRQLRRMPSGVMNSGISGPGALSASTDANERFVGRTIDRYEVEAVLGEGAYAWVLRARHVMLDRPAALKVLKPTEQNPEQVLQRFQKEGRLVSKLRHPNIVEVYDFGETPEGLPYMALEFLEGRDLREHLDATEEVPITEAVRMTCAVLDSLAAAHSHEVVHRDLKPENVFILKDGGIRVLDFGIAKVVEASQSAAGKVTTKDGGFIGTPKYCSPEQASGNPVGPWTDIYAAGLLLYELLAHQLPFKSQNALGYLTHHASTQPRSPKVHRPDVPDGLARAVLRALQKRPGSRFDSANEFREAIAPFLSDQA